MMVMVPVLAGGLNTNCSRAATEKCRNLIHRDSSSWRRRRMVLLVQVKIVPWVMVAGIKPPLPIYKCVIVTGYRLWPHSRALCSVIQQSSGGDCILYVVSGEGVACLMTAGHNYLFMLHKLLQSACCLVSRQSPVEMFSITPS